jgi:hypothetical protein
LARIIVIDQPFEGEPRPYQEPLTAPVPLSELVGRYWHDRPWDARINGLPVADEDRQTLVMDTDVVVIRPYVRGFVAPAIGAVSSWLGAHMIITSFLVSFLGGMLVKLLTKTPQTEAPGPSPWETQLFQKEGIPVARYYGRNRVSGNLIGQWRSTTETTHTVNPLWAWLNGCTGITNSYAQSEKLNLVVGMAGGPTNGVVSSSDRLNEQPLANFSGVTAVSNKGSVGQAALTGITEMPLEYQCEILTTMSGGPMTYTLPVGDMDVVEVRVSLPKGLNAVSNGGSGWWWIKYKVELSDTAVVSWHTLFNGRLAARTMTAIYASYRNTGTYDGGSAVNMAGWSGCMVRLTKVDTEGHTDGDNQISKFDELHLACVQAIYSTAFTFPMTAVSYVTAIPTEKLNGSLAYDALLDGSIINTYNGTSWALVGPADSANACNPAWVLLDLATQPVIKGEGTGGSPWAIDRYQGLDASQVDIDALWAIAQHCDELVTNGVGGTQKRHVFNGGFTEGTTVWAAILSVCDGIRCAPVWDGSTLTFVLDEVGTPIQLFNVGNIIQDSFRQSYLGQDDMASEVEVKFRDEQADYKSDDPVVVVDENRDDLENVVSVDLPFVTRRAEAWRFGRYRMLQNRLLLRTIEFAVSTEALNVGVGDLFYFQHDAIDPATSLGGRVISATANTIVVNRDATLGGALSVLVRVYDPITGRWAFEDQAVTSAVGSTITLTGAWTIIPKRDDVWVLGTAASYKHIFRATKLELQADKTTRVTGLEYNAGVFNCDTDTPIFGSTSTASAGTIGTSNPIPSPDDINTRAPVDGTNRLPDDSTWISNVTWGANDPGAGSISWTHTAATEPIYVTHANQSYEIADGSTALHYIYYDPTDPNVLTASDDITDMYACNGTLLQVNESGTPMQPDSIANTLYATLADIAAISPADGTFIVGDGAAWTAETGLTARTSMGVSNNHIAVSFNPISNYSVNAPVPLVLSTEAALHVIGIKVSCDSDPATEIDADIKYANAYIGLASPAVISAINTTAGVFDSGAIYVAVASGKCIYLEFGASPDPLIEFLAVDITFTYD